MSFAENRKRLKREAVFLFAFRILSFSFEISLMVINLIFLYMHLTLASEDLRNQISQDTSCSLMHQSFKVAASNCSTSLPCRTLCSSASCPLTSLDVASITYLAGPSSPAFLSSSCSLPLPPVPSKWHRAQPDCDVSGNVLGLCAKSHLCRRHTSHIRNAAFLEWWFWLA